MFNQSAESDFEFARRLNWFLLVTGMVVLSAWSGALQAGPITVPNASFESPATFFVSLNFDSWQRTPQPGWWDENASGPWTNLTGIFKNTTPGSSDHIDNCDGNQAAWLFAKPEAGLFQDYDSMAWNDPTPTHAFDAKFEVGNTYQLTVGVIGGGGAMQPGVPLAVSLYFRDSASNRVTVAATILTNSLTAFPTTTHLIDCTVSVPTVQAGDAWAGQNIGILFLSTVNPDLEGGYWDLDHVRLSSIRAPVLSSLVWTNSQFGFMLQSEPGLAFEILTTTNLALPSSNWISLGPLTNVAGTVPFVDTAPNFNQRFYRARQLP